MLLDWSNKKKLGFSSIEINETSCPSPQCLTDQIQVQKPPLLVATDKMPDLT